MNDQEGVKLTSDQHEHIKLLVNSGDEKGLHLVLEHYKVTSFENLFFEGDSLVFYFADLYYPQLEWISSAFKFNINVKNEDGKNVLYDKWRRPEKIEQLLKYDIDVNTKDSHNQSAVFWYAKLGYEEHVCLLLDHGASLKEAKEGLEICLRDSKDLWGRLSRYEEKETSCRESVAGFTLMGKVSKGTIHKDLIPMISNLVWFTRRREEWAGLDPMWGIHHME